MRGDQLARQWRVIRAIEASPNGLTVAEIANREETGIRTIYRDLEALRSHGHAKAQRAPRETFRVLLAFLNIFLVPSHLFGKTIEKFSGKHPLRPWRLGVRCLDDFMFALIREEIRNLSQIVTSSDIKHAPNVFAFADTRRIEKMDTQKPLIS